MRTLFILLLLSSSACAEDFSDRWYGRVAPLPRSGVASIYCDDEFDARGKKFIPYQISCAHPVERFNKILIVTNLEPGKSYGKQIKCPVQDRGPYKDGRVLDMSCGAAKAIGCTIKQGLCKVQIDREGYSNER